MSDETYDYPQTEHYADASGIYLGLLAAADAPEGAVVTGVAPENAGDQLWTAARQQWCWRIHYFVDADGHFVGAYSGPDKPAGMIEVLTAPEDARQIWNGASWDPVEDIE